ncbi:MAG: SDR family oxidoreductase [Anaerolineales bacterium]
MDLGLKDLRAVVAASSAGLGAATAAQLALEGAKVAINGRSAEKLAQTADHLRDSTGSDILAIPGDVSREEDARRLVEETAKQYGGIDILVTNAGGPPSGNFESLSNDDWRAAYDGLVMSTVYLVRAALPLLRLSEHAAILAVTSVSIKQPIDNLLLSNAVRMSVGGLVKTLANELGPKGIRVNAILPGWTRTDRVTYLLKQQAEQRESSVPAILQERTANVPLRRMAEPEEFGRVAAFLCSPAASYVHGAMIPVDGGSLRATL